MMEQRLIDANALMMKLMKGTIVSSDLYGMGVMSGIDFATEKLKNTPTVDAVEVVRCKECKHFAETKGKDSGKPCGYGQCKRPTGIRGIVCADDFCSYGERRDSDG